MLVISFLAFISTRIPLDFSNKFKKKEFGNDNIIMSRKKLTSSNNIYQY